MGRFRVKTVTIERVGYQLPDPFMDGYSEENLQCHDILDKLNLYKPKTVTVVIDAEFLKKIVHSHIHYIKTLDQ